MQAVIQVVVQVPGIANQLKIIMESLKNKEHMYGKCHSVNTLIINYSSIRHNNYLHGGRMVCLIREVVPISEAANSCLILLLDCHRVSWVRVRFWGRGLGHPRTFASNPGRTW